MSPPPATETSLPALVSAAASRASANVPSPNGRDLEGAERAVPQQRLAAADHARRSAPPSWARRRGSSGPPAFPAPAQTRDGAPASNFAATTTSCGSTTSQLRALAACMISSAVLVWSGSASDLPISTPSREEERVGHGAADDQLVDLGGEIGEHVDLGRDLGAADHGRRRALGLVEHAAQRVDLLHQQRAGIGRQQARDGVGGGVRAMRGGEGIVDDRCRRAPPAAWRTRDRSSPRPCGSAGSPARRCGPAAAPATVRSARLADAVARRTPPGGPAARRASSATGFRLNCGSGPPFGRPKCEIDDDAWRRAWQGRASPAPAARAASHRVTLPSLTGTLRSARTSTRLPLTSTPAVVLSLSRSIYRPDRASWPPRRLWPA